MQMYMCKCFCSAMTLRFVHALTMHILDTFCIRFNVYNGITLRFVHVITTLWIYSLLFIFTVLAIHKCKGIRYTDIIVHAQMHTNENAFAVR